MNAPVQSKTCANCGRVFTTEADFYRGTSRWRICDRKNLWFNCNCGSTLLLPKGKFDWYAPEKTLNGSAASVFNQIAALHTLPHIPSSVMEIQQLLQQAEADIGQLARKVKGDPFIAANILALANNIKSNRDPHDKKKIDNIEHAIMFVGKKTLSELVMTVSLKSFKNECKVFNPDAFWRESFLTGDIAEALADRFGEEIVKDEVFISATLCNLGKFVMALCLPDIVDQIETRLNNPKTLGTWQQAEAHFKTPSHQILGEIGATLWGLPLYVVESASQHHEIRTPRDVRRIESKLTLGEVVALANQMAHWVLLRPSRIDHELLKNICEVAKISKNDLDNLGAELSPLSRRAV